MKTSTVFCMTAAVASIAAHAATIDRVIVRQQWPWSTDVKVEYRVTGITTPVDVSVAAYDGDTPLDASRIAAATSGDVYGIASDGDYCITIDPVAAFGTARAAISKFNVGLSLSDSSASTTEVLYKIIDLDSFTAQDVTRADFMNGKMGDYVTDFKAISNKYWTALSDVLIWTGVTNVPAYRTSKIVMRRIPAKGVTFDIGNIPGCYKSWGGAGYAHVTLTNNYWISVFEVTEGQYKRMTAANGTLGTSPTSNGDNMPVGKMGYTVLRGSPSSWSNFPSDVYAVTASSAIGKLRANMPGYLFDLPTEAQWEYAGRAGTTNDLYIGYRTTGDAVFKAAVQSVMWCSNNSGGRVHFGGEKPPNAFGLYDMLGNEWEACRDLVSGTTPTAPSGDLTEPMGELDASKTYSARRGGNFVLGYDYCSIQTRRDQESITGAFPKHGFRLWLYEK